MNLNKPKNNWIAIKLIGKTAVNSQSIGASVTFPYDNVMQIREVDGGSAHSSQSSKILYFGLGKLKYANNLVIIWPGGKVTKIEKLKAGNSYTIDENGNIAILY